MAQVSYESLRAGATFQGRFVLTGDYVRRYAAITGCPWQATDPAPPAALAILDPVYGALGGSSPEGTIHVSHRLEQLRPVFVGDSFEVSVTVAAKRQRKARDVVELGIDYCRNGVLCSRQRAVFFWAAATTA